MSIEGGGQHAPRAAALDLGRIVAALAVLAFHHLYLIPEMGKAPWWSVASPLAQYGYLGVEFFFMLSGYVIAQSAERRSRFEFARDRAARLVPAFVICLALTCAVRAWEGRPLAGIDIVANLTFQAGNLGREYADDVYWSLAVEVIFYATVWLFLTGRTFQRRVRTFLVGWGALALLGPGGLVSVLLNLSWAPFFGVGISAYLWNRGRRRIDLGLFLLFVVGAGAMAAKQVTGVGNGLSVRPDPVAAAAIVAVMGAGMAWLPRIDVSPFWARIALVAGAISYPLYLLHNEFSRPFFVAAFPAFALTALTAVGLGAVCYAVTLIEAPLRQAIRSIGGSKPAPR